MKEPDSFESELRSYLAERSRRATDPAVTDRLLESVTRRAQRTHRLAPLASVAIALAVVLLVGAPTTMILLHRGSHVSAPPQTKKPLLPPTFATTPPTSPTPSAAATAVVVVSRVTFADVNHGWAVGTSCLSSADTCDVLVDSSADGGTTWSPAAVLAQYSTITLPPASGGALSVSAEGDNVWVAAGAAGIYESHDGGGSWVHSFTSPVLAVAAGPTAAWALVGCFPTGTPCVLYTSKVGSDSWGVAPNQPPFTADSSGQTRELPSAIDVTRNGAVLLFNLPQGTQFLLSTDGGQSWVSHRLPCTIGVESPQTVDGKALWALCVGAQGASQETKAVYVSDDSGLTWEERANDMVTPPVGNISVGGYAGRLELTEQDVALVGAERGGIQRSTDGGRTWTPVRPPASCPYGDNNVDLQWFLPSGDGWALEGNDNGDPACPLLVRTTDGGITWESAGAPLGWTANQRK